MTKAQLSARSAREMHAEHKREMAQRASAREDWAERNLRRYGVRKLVEFN